MYIANRVFRSSGGWGFCFFVLEICHFARFQLQLKLISDKRNKFRIRGFSLGIADSIAKKSLECIQIATIPGDFDGMSDGPLDAAGGGLECLCHLGVEHLGDGIRVPDGPPGGASGQGVWRGICK